MRSADPATAATERTALAWDRTALGFAGLTALLVAAAGHRNASWILLAAVVTAGGTLATWREGRRLRRSGPVPVPEQGARLRRLRLCTLAAAVACALVQLV